MHMCILYNTHPLILTIQYTVMVKEKFTCITFSTQHPQVPHFMDCPGSVGLCFLFAHCTQYYGYSSLHCGKANEVAMLWDLFF